jgi:hypothetical protein
MLNQFLKKKSIEYNLLEKQYLKIITKVDQESSSSSDSDASLDRAYLAISQKY